MKILIVDKDKAITETLKEHLEENYNCFIAHDGNLASKIMAKCDFDLIITGIEIPNGGGERVLSEAASRNTAAFVFTGKNLKDYSKFFALGAINIYFKPDIESLIQAVRNLLDGNLVP